MDTYEDHAKSLTDSDTADPPRLCRHQPGRRLRRRRQSCRIRHHHHRRRWPTAGEVKIPVKDGTAPGYRAMPATGTHFPTVLVIQEVFGVHEHIRDLCRRLAKLGYYAIATELYARQGDVSKLTDISDIIKIVATVPNDQVMSDLDASVAFAQSEGADTENWASPASAGAVARLGSIPRTIRR